MLKYLRLSILLFVSIPVFAEVKIAVIGAGLSGLTVAYRLKKAGYNADVYEARNRVGGRVFTVNINNSTEELGGKNLNDGGEALSIKHLIQEVGLSIDSYPVKSAYYYYDSDQNQSLNFYGEEVPPFPPLSAQILEELKKIEKKSKNMAEVLDQFFDKYPLQKKIYSNRLRSYEGSEPYNLAPSYAHGSFLDMLKASEKRLASYRRAEPIIFPAMNIRGGNAQLPVALAQRLTKPIHFQHILKSIHKSKSIDLEFSSGQHIQADLVVITVPASVFKNIQVGEDLISAERWKKMGELSYGKIAKILVPVHLNDQMFGTVFTDQTLTWFNKDRKIVTFYYAGQSALFGNEMQKTLERDVKAVQATFPGIGLPSSLSVQSPKDIQFSNYDTAVGTSWASDPFTLGGYSIYDPDQDLDLRKTVEVLGEKTIPLYQPVDQKIFFAGEHTALENSATMEGAVESGERTARMIIRALEKL